MGRERLQTAALRVLAPIAYPGAVSHPTPALRVLVFGEQRSGTTLLSEVLQAQPGVVVLARQQLAPMLYSAFRELGLRADQLLGARQQHVLRRKAGLPEGVQADTVDGVHRAVLADARAHSDQHAAHVLHGPIEAVEGLLQSPDVRCLALVRDARDVILSRAYRGEQRLDEALLAWKATSARLHALRDHARLEVLRFEDLITEPDRELGRVAALLELASPLALPAADAEGRPTLQNSSFALLERAFDPSAVERWRAHMDNRAVRYAQWLCERELRAWGYAIDPELQPSPRERVRFLRRRAVVEALELPRRAKNAVLARALPSLLDE
ncbi:MAG: sulfotransferase domain-containing protein [Myxococcales bacterium]|nr:sulfotransferase domain-containing protein [Myxococcales bacterium]